MTPSPSPASENPRMPTSVGYSQDHSSISASDTNVRNSFASSENGESSTAGSNRYSDATLNDGAVDGDYDSRVENAKQHGRSNHRSHRSRNSGAFLLSNSNFETSIGGQASTEKKTQRSSRDTKGKAVAHGPERKHTKKRSAVGLGIGSSPLAGNVTVPHPAEASDGEISREQSEGGGVAGRSRATSSGIDVDSVQMVNLALNLSESRRNAARRIVSTPLQPLAATFGESFAGGSLRQHLQQQRRVSRNISPKPQKASFPRSASTQLNSPLHANFDSSDTYQYNFSASTLARAEKAKTQIELMAQYRRLLQYVPPLKPVGTESPETPKKGSQQVLGRRYNPLQYIRNRKVRARERKAIDGESQGFGDLENVTSWVDEVLSSSSAFDESGDRASIPVFSKAAEMASSPHASPKPALGKSPTVLPKVKRPRVDWDMNPADMLADLFWVEQDENKTLIEDRLGRKIYPQTPVTKRSVSKRSDEPEAQTSSPNTRKALSPDLRIDTQLPQFKSIKADGDKHNSATTRARNRLRDAARIPHSAAREPRQFLHPRGKSDSDTSDTDYTREPRRTRNGQAESSFDHSVDILNKQMMELLAKEGRANAWKNVDSQNALSKGTSRNSLDYDQSNSGSIVALREERSKRHSVISSGRPSLEVPGSNPRGSMDELDTTAPNSPQSRGSNVEMFPSISMDLTPPTHRQPSPSRNTIAKVRNKINPFEHTRTHSRGRAATTTLSGVPNPFGSGEHSIESPEAEEIRHRSMSPIKQAVSKPAGDSAKSSRKSSLRRGKAGDEASGIRGLFKGRRGPVATVSDLFSKKDSHAHSSEFSTDDSDGDDRRSSRDRGSRDSSVGPMDDIQEISPSKEKHRYDLPTFVSQAERGRSNGDGDKNASGESTSERRNSSGHLLDTPRIDIQNASPGSSPENLIRSDSSVSELNSRRSSYAAQQAAARLDDLLGMPGRRTRAWPVTGLSSVAPFEKRPSIEGKRQWSISDRDVSEHRGPMTRREVARVRALLLSSGIKAKEISRRALEPKDLYDTKIPVYRGIAELSQERVKPIPKCQQHIIAAKILSDNMQLSKSVWQASVDTFCNTTVQDLVNTIEELKGNIQDSLAPAARVAADEADELSKMIVSRQTLEIKQLADGMEKMIRRRKRRFRWLRRGGWLLVEWGVVGGMWLVWLLVTIANLFKTLQRAVVGTTRWLLWL